MRDLSHLTELEESLKDWERLICISALCHGGGQAAKAGYGFRIAFPEAVAGPVALGEASHYGIGGLEWIEWGRSRRQKKNQGTVGDVLTRKIANFEKWLEKAESLVTLWLFTQE